MKKEQFIKPLIEVVEINDKIISTSGGGTYIDPETQGGGEFPEIDPFA